MKPKILDKRITKISFFKTSTKFSLSKVFLKTLDITEESPYVEVIYTTGEIIIRKAEEQTKN